MQPLVCSGKWMPGTQAWLLKCLAGGQSVGFLGPLMHVHHFHQCPVQIITPLADNQTNAASSNTRQRFVATNAVCILHTLQPCQQLGLVVRDQSAH